MHYFDALNQLVTLVEGINSLSELMSSDKLPSWMFLVGLNLNYSPKDKNPTKKEPS